jgi:hypothetical protein
VATPCPPSRKEALDRLTTKGGGSPPSSSSLLMLRRVRQTQAGPLQLRGGGGALVQNLYRGTLSG